MDNLEVLNLHVFVRCSERWRRKVMYCSLKEKK